MINSRLLQYTSDHQQWIFDLILVRLFLQFIFAVNIARSTERYWWIVWNRTAYTKRIDSTLGFLYAFPFLYLEKQLVYDTISPSETELQLDLLQVLLKPTFIHFNTQTVPSQPCLAVSGGTDAGNVVVFRR